VWEQLDEAWGKRARTDIPSRHPILQNEQLSYEVTFDTKNETYVLYEHGQISKRWVLGRKTISRKIEIHIIDQGKDGEAAIVVHDNGPGMSPEELKRM
jgi:nitrogen fixation/metabolism regulation signal transduction histidine kinase